MAALRTIRSLASALNRGIASRLHTTPEATTFYALTPVVGVVTGIVGMAICDGIDLVQRLVWHSDARLLDAAMSAPPWLKILAPTLGGLFVALLVWVTRQPVRGHGTSAILEAVAAKGGRIAPGPVLLRELAGIATVGSGGSLGREGPLIRTGAMIGSVLGEKLGGLSGRRLKTLVGCGAAAGMAAAYNAPIGGAIFALEVVLGTFELEVIGPVVLASVLGTELARAVHGASPAYHIPHYSLVSAWELPAYLVLGILMGPLAIAFARGVRGGERAVDRIRWIPEGLKPIVGMALLGVIGLALPYVYGNGFDTVNLALHEDARLGIGLLLLLPLVKVATTALTLGCGCTGGLFTPALFVGGLLGGLYGCAVHALIPGASATYGAYVLGGMVAITAGTSHAPISSILIIFEMTRDYQAMLPFMLAAVGAAGVARKINPWSIYTESLAKKGITLRGALDDAAPASAVLVSLPQDVTVREMKTPLAILGEPLRELSLPERYGVLILARVSTQGGAERREMVSAATRLGEGDRILAVGTQKALEQIQGVESGHPPASDPVVAPPTA